MCQRFSMALTKDKLASIFDKVEFSIPYEADYNIAPGKNAYVLTSEDPNVIKSYQWGLIPHWSKSGEQNCTLYNANAEGIASKASFRIPIRNTRCVILADSFYLWRNSNQTGDVYRVVPRDGSILCFAGLYDVWNKEGIIKNTFTIVTNTANKEVSQISSTMPVILYGNSVKRWLQTDSLLDCLEILKERNSGTLHIYKVTDRIRDVHYNTVDLHSKIVESQTLFDLQ